MKNVISIVTANRAEYGLLRNLIIGLKEEKNIEVNLAVTGAHLSSEFGYTYKEIENDNIEINEKIEMLMSSDSPASTTKSMGIALMGFADYFHRIKPDTVILLGDRYEIMAVAIAAMNQRIPICHIHGGETGAGTVDNMIRHAISKMSTLHFTSTEAYRKRVVQLGEHPSKVYNVGALGVENIKKMELMSKDKLEENLNFILDNKTILVTFHPLSFVENVEEQFNELLRALDKLGDLRVIFTKANPDTGGRVINKMIDNFVEKNKHRAIVFFSLGTVRYLSALKYIKAVVGNSSSGIIEAPSIGTYTLDIGERQKGRIRGESVYNCEVNEDEIIEKLKLILNLEKKERFFNPYEKDETSKEIIKILKINLELGIQSDKDFFDLKEIQNAKI